MKWNLDIPEKGNFNCIVKEKHTLQVTKCKQWLYKKILSILNPPDNKWKTLHMDDMTPFWI